MLYRLKKCTDKIYMGTLQEVDLLDNLKYKKIKEILKQIGEN